MPQLPDITCTVIIWFFVHFLSHLKLLPHEHIIPKLLCCVGCFLFGRHVPEAHCQAFSTFPWWWAELIFSCGEQIGGWQSSTAIRAAEEAKCACDWRSTQMTVPKGQQFPSAGASARWSLARWVWLIWHISDDRWTSPLTRSSPVINLIFLCIRRTAWDVSRMLLESDWTAPSTLVINNVGNGAGRIEAPDECIQSDRKRASL